VAAWGFGGEVAAAVEAVQAATGAGGTAFGSGATTKAASRRPLRCLTGIQWPLCLQAFSLPAPRKQSHHATWGSKAVCAPTSILAHHSCDSPLPSASIRCQECLEGGCLHRDDVAVVVERRTLLPRNCTVTMRKPQPRIWSSLSPSMAMRIRNPRRRSSPRGEMMMAGKPSPPPNYHPVQINQPDTWHPGASGLPSGGVSL
jgi:hypothetical protein